MQTLSVGNNVIYLQCKMYVDFISCNKNINKNPHFPLFILTRVRFLTSAQKERKWILWVLLRLFSHPGHFHWRLSGDIVSTCCVLHNRHRVLRKIFLLWLEKYACKTTPYRNQHNHFQLFSPSTSGTNCCFLKIVPLWFIMYLLWCATLYH